MIIIFIVNRSLLKISAVENVSYLYIISLFILNLVMIRVLPGNNN